MRTKVVFLSRWGILQEKDPSGRIIIPPGTTDLLQSIAEFDWTPIVTDKEDDGETEELLFQLRIQSPSGINLSINDFLYCPHSAKKPCLCRKPHPGLLYKALIERDLSTDKSILIGAQREDITAGQDLSWDKVWIQKRKRSAPRLSKSPRYFSCNSMGDANKIFRGYAAGWRLIDCKKISWVSIPQSIHCPKCFLYWHGILPSTPYDWKGCFCSVTPP